MGRRGFRYAALAAALSCVSVMLFPAAAQASLANCQNIYVISVSLTMADPRPWITFGETPSATSGSQLTYPTTGFTERAYEQLYATLLTAKINGSRVSITTAAGDQCSITSGSQYLTSIQLTPAS